jgi:hypothetical protein
MLLPHQSSLVRVRALSPSRTYIAYLGRAPREVPIPLTPCGATVSLAIMSAVYQWLAPDIAQHPSPSHKPALAEDGEEDVSRHVHESL